MDLDRQLIKEVESHPILYDPSQTGYKNIENKREVWNKIGRKLIGGKDEVTSGILLFVFFSKLVYVSNCI